MVKKTIMAAVICTIFILPLMSQGFDEELQTLGFETPQEPMSAIDFELINLDGEKVTLSSMEGKLVFLNFWATWCGPCRSEMPSMEKLYDELKDEDFIILAVDLGEPENTVRDFVNEYGLTFPVLLDTDNAVGSSYGARSIPTTYIIDPEGMVLARAVGARDWNTADFKTLFRSIIAGYKQD